MKRALAVAALVAGCSQPGTGVALTIDGTVSLDRLTIIATYDKRSVSRNVAIPAGTKMPTTLLAELPDDAFKVTFDVTALLAGKAVAHTVSPPVDVEAHRIAAVTITLGGAPSDGGAALDGAPDGAAPAWTLLTGGGNPPQGAALTGLWGTAAELYATSTLAGGANLLHSTDSGQHFTPSLAAASTANLNAVWGASATDVVLVGDSGVVLRGSGSTWTPSTTPAGTGVALYGVWGSSATDVYVVGSGNTILHSVTGGWVLQTAVGTTVLRAVWGAGGQLWAVGSGGAILRSSGTTWAPETSGTSSDLYGVWGAGGAIWAVGDAGTVLRSSGDGHWARETGGVPQVALAAVWGSSGGDVYAVGGAWTLLHSAGDGQWAALPSGLTVDNAAADRLAAVFGTSATSVFAAGAGATVLRAP